MKADMFGKSYIKDKSSGVFNEVLENEILRLRELYEGSSSEVDKLQDKIKDLESAKDYYEELADYYIKLHARVGEKDIYYQVRIGKLEWQIHQLKSELRLLRIFTSCAFR